MSAIPAAERATANRRPVPPGDERAMGPRAGAGSAPIGGRRIRRGTGP